MEKSYHMWEPALTPEDVFSESVSLSELKVVGTKLYWLESRSSGKSVIVEWDGKNRDITPESFDVRTRVHEYGGGAYTVDEENVYFVNKSDQRIYKQSLNSEEIKVFTIEKNKDGSMGKYANLEIVDNRLYFIYEKEYDDKENINCIAYLDINKDLVEPTVLVEGQDFYSNVCFSNDGKKMAWLSWNHPNMPWDQTSLFEGIIEEKGSVLVISEIKQVAGGDGASVSNAKFHPDGRLIFSLDLAGQLENSPLNWWNLYTVDGEKLIKITEYNAEIGFPHWIFGTSLFDFIGDGRIIVSSLEKGVGSILLIGSKKIMTGLDQVLYLRSYLENGFAAIVTSPTEPSKIIVCSNVEEKSHTVVKESKKSLLSQENISSPKLISFPTKEGIKAYGYFYLPKNSKYSPPEGEKSPLIIFVHGGPTSRARVGFSLMKQFWTTQGYAILDIDYHGSTGYGRQFRDSLLGKWGDIDAQDIQDAVNYLIGEKKVDPDKIFIRGGSAGGYAVQRILTLYPNLCRAGASYYGIGNLSTLVEETHKFESRYLDKIVAPWPEGKEVYDLRSPIFHMSKLKSPMILFQGKLDKVVPPSVSREVVNKLKEKGIKHEYYEYEGEAHGFRSKAVNVDSLSKEAKFYKSVLLH